VRWGAVRVELCLTHSAFKRLAWFQPLNLKCDILVFTKFGFQMRLVPLRCDVKAGTVQVRCENSAKLGERKNMNLPGVNVDLPTITVGLYKLRIQFTYSLKAPGFNP
jgi:hypothetical protein